MSLRSRPIPNIIQGVSQQTPEERRDAQCEDEVNIVNYPVRGAVARYGTDMSSFIALKAIPGVFTYEVRRGTSEHYLFIINAGSLAIWDLNTFTQCTVTFPAGKDYLHNPGGWLDEDLFRIQSVGDRHFLVNKSIIPQMDPASASPNPNPAAIVFVQAGNYLTTYSISVEYAGVVYTYTYQTPDNTVETNFQFVTSNQIAATFFRAMTGVGANTTGTGPTGAPGSALQGVTGAGYATAYSPTISTTGKFINPGSGNVGGTGTTLTSLGFTVKIDGNLLLIERASDQNPFTLNASDGSGDKGLTVVQDQVQDLTDLPQGGFDGYVVQVMGVGGGNVAAAPYYLQYNSNAANGGAWVETLAKNTPQNFLFSTMPMTIFCLAPNSFAFRTPNWLPRISGDGTTSALQPGFIGQPLQDVGFYNGRLCLMGQSTYDFTQARNVLNFWPKTAQATLDDAPISGELAASDTTATLQRAVVVDEQFIIWAQRAQFRINSGIQSFTATNIQDPESTTYEFNENCPFFKVGTSVYFAYDSGGYSRIFVLQYQQGRAVGDTEITAHVPEYIPAGVRGISGSVPIKMLFVRTDGKTNSLYLYNWLDEGGSVVQSAWNRWDLPVGTIIWHTIYQQTLYLMMYRYDAAYWMTVPLNAASKDPGGSYQTRLDMRITEVGLKPIYNATNNTTSFTLPYGVQVAEQANYRVVIRKASAQYVRGTVLRITAMTEHTCVVEGNVVAEQFYAGFRIVSTRLESDFYVRTSTGHIPTDRLTVKNYHMNYRNSLGGSIVVTDKKTGKQFTTSIGLPGTTELGAEPALMSGELIAGVDKDPLKCTIVAINDTPFPSEWTSVTVDFEMTARAGAMLTPYGGPVQ